MNKEKEEKNWKAFGGMKPIFVVVSRFNPLRFSQWMQIDDFELQNEFINLVVCQPAAWPLTQDKKEFKG